jgi:hypothetical protein
LIKLAERTLEQTVKVDGENSLENGEREYWWLFSSFSLRTNECCKVHRTGKVKNKRNESFL